MLNKSLGLGEGCIVAGEEKMGVALQMGRTGQPRSPDLRCCYMVCTAFCDPAQDNRGSMDLSKPSVINRSLKNMPK